MFPFH